MLWNLLNKTHTHTQILSVTPDFRGITDQHEVCLVPTLRSFTAIICQQTLPLTLLLLL